MTRRRKRVAELFAELAAEYRAASIVETVHEHRDTFDRAHSRVSVELCHGEWCTFARAFAAQATESAFRRHASRDDARAWARAWLT